MNWNFLMLLLISFSAASSQPPIPLLLEEIAQQDFLVEDENCSIKTAAIVATMVKLHVQIMMIFFVFFCY